MVGTDIFDPNFCGKSELQKSFRLQIIFALYSNVVDVEVEMVLLS